MTPLSEGTRRLAAAALVVLVAGVVVVALTGGATEIALGGGLIAIAGVLAVSAFFYAVGRSEDRERSARNRR